MDYRSASWNTINEFAKGNDLFLTVEQVSESQKQVYMRVNVQLGKVVCGHNWPSVLNCTPPTDDSGPSRWHGTASTYHSPQKSQVGHALCLVWSFSNDLTNEQRHVYDGRAEGGAVVWYTRRLEGTHARLTETVPSWHDDEITPLTDSEEQTKT